jgi:transcriptional regulator GlxA family with amidase domain
METPNRRGVSEIVAAGIPASVEGSGVADDNVPIASQDGFGRMHDRHRPSVGMLLYPGLTLMDLVGPQTVLSPSCDIHLVGKTRDWVESDTGIALRPTATFADCPANLDVLFVGGGPGQLAIMNDKPTIQFLADQGRRAKYVTSVCLGSLVLGAAGLVRGYESACHWACRDALRMFGAIPIAKRVVADRNRLSGGGMTAGIDFGLILLATLLGEDLAKMTQLIMEYDPEPPFDAGSPQKAGPVLIGKVMDWIAPFGAKMLAACEQAASSMPS